MTPDFSFIQLQPARVPLVFKVCGGLALVAGFVYGLFWGGV